MQRLVSEPDPRTTYVKHGIHRLEKDIPEDAKVLQPKRLQAAHAKQRQSFVPWLNLPLSKSDRKSEKVVRTKYSDHPA